MKNNFSDLCGVWGREDLEEFEKATADLEKIEREF